MTGFTPVMDFSVLPSISPILPLSLLQKFARLHAKLLLDGCKEKKNGKLSSKHAGPSF